jgi:hypothetical protein
MFNFLRKQSNNQELIINVFIEKLPNDSYAKKALMAFAKGVQKVGDTCKVVDKLEYEECDIAVIFGDVRDAPAKKKRMRLKAEVKGRHIHNGLMVIDTPVLMRPFDKKENFRRIGIDSLFADIGNFNNENCDDKRWKKLSQNYGIALNFSKKRGDNIYILLQRFYDASLKGSQRLRPKKYFAWLDGVIQELKNETNRKIIIRPHPGSLNVEEELELIEKFKMKKENTNVIFDYQKKNLFEVLDDAFVTITYNSGSAIDSLMYGIPNVTYDSGSHAYNITPHNCKNIENIQFPEKDKFMQWLYNLSYVDWTIDEMREGLPWLHLKYKILEYI